MTRPKGEPPRNMAASVKTRLMSVHTVFCGCESEGRETFRRMKAGLDTIMDTLPVNDDPDADAKTRTVAAAIQEFVETFP